MAFTLSRAHKARCSALHMKSSYLQPPSQDTPYPAFVPPPPPPTVGQGLSDSEIAPPEKFLLNLHSDLVAGVDIIAVPQSSIWLLTLTWTSTTTQEAEDTPTLFAPTHTGATMITLPKDEEARMEAQRGRFSPSSPSSSRSIPFRSGDSDDHTETDALLSDMDSHSVWVSGPRGVSEASSSSNPHRPLLHHPTASGDADPRTSIGYTYPDHPPPNFAPYEAEYFEVGNEDICSHDPPLNSDGEALYRFILARAQRPPFLRVNIAGTHTEHKTRWVTRTGNDGRSRQELENYSETVTDFSFCIDIKPVVYTTRTSDGSVGGQIPIDPVHWSVADHVPAYRGKMVKEVEEVKVPGLGAMRRERRKCKRKERKVRERWQEEIQGKGLPPWCEEHEVDFESISSLALSGNNSNPWVESLADVERNPLRSSRTIRQWADDYCASPKKLKEFVYIQELYGDTV
ncbi:hypothetical protein NMY22_g9715 [Coprinellus aureogranulatus]|nr:hypothetical protein NMY22_g9715 [Coprinellus aureogranulatus]